MGIQDLHPCRKPIDSDFGYDNYAIYMRLAWEDVVGPLSTGPINEKSAEPAVQEASEDKPAQNVRFDALRRKYEHEERDSDQEDDRLSTQSPGNGSLMPSVSHGTVKEPNWSYFDLDTSELPTTGNILARDRSIKQTGSKLAGYLSPKPKSIASSESHQAVSSKRKPGRRGPLPRRKIPPNYKSETDNGEPLPSQAASLPLNFLGLANDLRLQNAVTYEEPWIMGRTLPIQISVYTGDSLGKRSKLQ
jgi:hypothetical protein